jgi:2-dehydropantoate 2-reductase
MSNINLSYAVIGTGAVGGFYGAKLQSIGFEVHFLLHEDYEHVCKNGLKIESIDGDFALPKINAYQYAHEMPTCDVVIVALKAVNNSVLPKLLPYLLNKNTIILLLQNGLGAEQEIASWIGTRSLVSGICSLRANKIKPGYIRHLHSGAITLAEYGLDYVPQGITNSMKALAQNFEIAGISITLSENLLLSRWRKLLWNIPFNGLSVVYNATPDVIIFKAQSLLEQLMEEVLLGAKSCNCTFSSDLIYKILENTAKMKPYCTSMKIDYDRKQPLEIEAIYGNPLKIAHQHNVRLPRIEMLYKKLKFLDFQNRRNRNYS